MNRFKLILLLVFIFQFACNTITNPSSVLPGPDATQPVTENTSGAAPDATKKATESGAPSSSVFLPSFGPDYFSKLQLLHDYWPAVAAAANMSPDAIAVKSVGIAYYSLDGQYLAVAGCDAEVGNGDPYSPGFFVNCEDDTSAHAYLFILDAKAGNIIQTLPPTGKKVTVESLDFSRDGSKLVYALSSGEVTIWDIVSKTASAISQEANPYAFAEFSPDGLFIAIRGNPNGKIWDVINQKFVAELTEPPYGFPDFSADDKVLNWENYPNAATYDTSSWKKINSVTVQYNEENNQNSTSAIVGTLDTTLVLNILAESAVETKDAPVGIWDLNTGQKIHSLEGKWSNSFVLEFTPDGKWLLHFDDTGRELSMWQTDTWQYFDASSGIQNIVSKDDGYCEYLEFSEDGQTVLVETYDRLALYGLP